MKWCRMYERVKIVMNSSTHIYKVTNVGQHHFREGLVVALALSRVVGLFTTGELSPLTHAFLTVRLPIVEYRFSETENTPQSKDTTCKVNDNIKREL